MNVLHLRKRLIAKGSGALKDKRYVSFGKEADLRSRRGPPYMLGLDGLAEAPDETNVDVAIRQKRVP